ncbi:MAG: ribosome biogenesis GTPase Der [Bacilli bacterium]
MKKYTVALVGRPNTGKSTIFNKLVGKREAIIEDHPGVTRDRIYSNVDFFGKTFGLIDTGGIDLSDGDFNTQVNMQVDIAIEESDVIVLVVDGKDGITSNDLIIRDKLKRCGKKVVVAINKVDARVARDNIYDFYKLGFDDYFEVSGEQNFGINDMFNFITKDFNNYIDEDENKLKFCVIGRPNTGKSSLVNALLNEERVIVSDVAGTTRDAIDTPFKYNGSDYILIDTAGLRKKGRIFESVEKYSLIRSMKAIDRSDVCLLVLDGLEGIVEHDKHIASYALEAGKAIVLVVNKWDLIDEKEEYIKKMTATIKDEFQFLPWASIVFLSALTKKRIHTLMPEVLLSYENTIKEVKTSVINEIITDAYIENPAPIVKNKRPKIYFCHQSGIKPPRFDIEVNSRMLIHFSYKRYLENKIRSSIDFKGTPIILQFKNKGENK